MSIFSKRLKELRKEKGLSQQELSIALKFKITQPAIARWENDERVPNLDAVILLAKFFNVSLDYLAGLTEFK
ncbi:MAG: helix-turn-helix transcriptional regulator [Clostridia bacterium]|nr:helix-turn-helix transcriptional regulator [Clostridia bacterium]